MSSGQGNLFLTEVSSWLQQIGYGVYVLMSLVCDWKNDCVFFREFFYVICEKEK